MPPPRSPKTPAGPRALKDAWTGDAVERLVLGHQATVRGFLRYLGCPAGLLDDLVQETFLTLLSAEFELRSDAATARYLRSIARHLFLKSLRRLNHRAPALDLDAAENVWVKAQADDGGSRYMDALRRCLEAVTDRTRAVLELRYTGGLERKAIAQRMELSESGVHSILVRARRKLRSCVERGMES